MPAYSLPVPQSPICDVSTGIISRDWYLFLAQLFTITGGSSGGSSPTPPSNLPDVEALVELTRPPNISALMQRIEALEALIQTQHQPIQQPAPEVGFLLKRPADIDSLVQRVSNLEALTLAK